MTASTTATTESPPTTAWDRLLVAAVAVVIAADVTVQVLAQTVIPPLAIVTLVSLVGLGLYRWKRRVGIAVLGLTALVWGLGSIGFSADHLQHPESGIDFVHATIEVVGRVAIVIAAIAAWRNATGAWTRRVAIGAGAVLAAAAVVGTATSVASAGDTPQSGDTEATIEHAEFPEEIRVAAGDSLYVENADLFRHTFTVEDTAIDVEVPSRRGARVQVDLPAGSYTVLCSVPGHEFMQSTLVVE